jgi:hypothetical protein
LSAGTRSNAVRVFFISASNSGSRNSLIGMSFSSSGLYGLELSPSLCPSVVDFQDVSTPNVRATVDCHFDASSASQIPFALRFENLRSSL